jgi:hypothetical protein
LLYVLAHTSDRDLRHDDVGLPVASLSVAIGTAYAQFELLLFCCSW